MYTMWQPFEVQTAKGVSFVSPRESPPKPCRRAERAGYALPTREETLRQANAAMGVVARGDGDPAPLGPLLLAVARMAHQHGVEGEEALRRSLADFERELRAWRDEAD